LLDFFLCELYYDAWIHRHQACRTFLWKLVNLVHKIKYQIMWKHTVCNIIRGIGKTDVPSKYNTQNSYLISILLSMWNISFTNSATKTAWIYITPDNARKENQMQQHSLKKIKRNIIKQLHATNTQHYIILTKCIKHNNNKIRVPNNVHNKLS